MGVEWIEIYIGFYGVCFDVFDRVEKELDKIVVMVEVVRVVGLGVNVGYDLMVENILVFFVCVLFICEMFIGYGFMVDVLVYGFVESVCWFWVVMGEV